MKISGTSKRATLMINGKRCGVWLSVGNFTGNLEGMIRLYPKRHYFPAEFRGLMAIENHTDVLTDYFDDDKISLFPGHPLYEDAKRVAAL